MKAIPSGSFILGSTNRLPDEMPVVYITLSDFWIARTQVTQRQYRALMRANPSHFRGDQLPVEQVRWSDAVAFCDRLNTASERLGLLPSGFRYTLPTEAQWEFACRAGATGDFAGDLDAMAWYDSNSERATHPVGTKAPNAWGLYDMQGNVSEWCADRYAPYTGGAAIDHRGPSAGPGHVVRGGGWCCGATVCRSAFRSWYSPGSSNFLVGFRVVLAPVASPPANEPDSTTFPTIPKAKVIFAGNGKR